MSDISQEQYAEAIFTIMDRKLAALQAELASLKSWRESALAELERLSAEVEQLKQRNAELERDLLQTKQSRNEEQKLRQVAEQQPIGRGVWAATRSLTQSEREAMHLSHMKSVEIVEDEDDSLGEAATKGDQS